MPLFSISADSHVTEPGDCYLPRIDPKFRSRAPVAPVGDNTRQEGEQHDRDLPHELIDAQPEGVLGQVEHQPRLRRRLHLRADLRGAGADPHQPEVAEVERLEDPLEE